MRQATSKEHLERAHFELVHKRLCQTSFVGLLAPSPARLLQNLAVANPILNQRDCLLFPNGADDQATQDA